jgi:L-lactate utilization protein LutB
MSAGFIDTDKDLSEVIRLVSSQTKDPDALRRARELADNIREEMKEKYGTLDVAVSLVNEVRNSK